MKKEKIKILYVNHIGDVMGGAEHSLAILLKNLNKEVFYPILLLPDYGPVYEHFVSIGIETYVVPINYLWLPEKKQYYRLLQDIKARLDWFNEIISKEDIDIIHTNDEEIFDGAIASRIHGIPHSWHIRHRFSDNAQPVFNYFSLHGFGMGSFINEFSDRVISISAGVKKSLDSYIKPEKLITVYNAVEADRYKLLKNDIRKELGLPADTFLVCSAGRVCKEKGFDVYIEAAAHILKNRKDVKFLIVGKETEKGLINKLKEQARKLQLEDYIYFLGYQQDFPNILQQVDVFILASVAGEGLGRVVIESSAAQKPVVVSQFCGSDEVVSDSETGYIVPLKRPDLVAEKIIHLLDNPQLRSEMGSKGRKMVKEKFSVAAHVGKMEAIYHELIQTKQNDKKMNIPLNLIVNMLGELGNLGTRLIEHEDRIKSLENFQDRFKNNVLYKGIRRIYGIFIDGQRRQ